MILHPPAQAGHCIPGQSRKLGHVLTRANGTVMDDLFHTSSLGMGRDVAAGDVIERNFGNGCPRGIDHHAVLSRFECGCDTFFVQHIAHCVTHVPAFEPAAVRGRAREHGDFFPGLDQQPDNPRTELTRAAENEDAIGECGRGDAPQEQRSTDRTQYTLLHAHRLCCLLEVMLRV